MELARDSAVLGHGSYGAMAWSGRRLVSLGDRKVIYSNNGDRWEPAIIRATADRLHDVVWGNGRFVAVGWNGTIVTSP